MNIQQTQEVLNYLSLIITASFTTVMLVDFGWGLVHLWHEVSAQIEVGTTNNTSEQSNIEFCETINTNLHLEKENCHPSADYNSVVHSSANIEHNNGNQLGVLDDGLTKGEKQDQSTISTNLEYDNSNQLGVLDDDLTKVEAVNQSTISTKFEDDNGNQPSVSDDDVIKGEAVNQSNNSNTSENNNSNQSNDNTPLQSELEVNNSITVDIDKIDLRTARKIASAIKKSTNPKSDLIIKQKVNGKNVPLAWLQAQIKNRLEIAPEIVQTSIQELAPNAIHDSDKNIQTYHILQKDKHQRQFG
ncbi:hypothetical protein A0J48_013355 [Sphaerospermopsis aphanizomenoides BCCUSP55]|uniref:hypothetical protein n=1 Tax=Sphaerospermopsis aphanizomenoides TaxID=459663 RepID=UPI001907DDD8|nr:hypothetical protein [Sphaerospermopsis aphanizomenoides]MBK1988512.1 hypothetical protein [Sphaerospermopsis aphanizomenoides BCCUSP55]